MQGVVIMINGAMKTEKCFPPPAFDFCRGKCLILWIVVKASIIKIFTLPFLCRKLHFKTLTLNLK